MKRILLTIAFVVLLLSLAAAEPALEIPVQSFDFGKITQLSIVTHSFWLKSVGEDTLRVVKIWPGCGCTQAPLEDSVIAPGDSTELKIILDTRRFRGNVVKRPQVMTNADTTTRINMNITCEMELAPDSSYPLVLTPRSLDASQFTEKTRRRTKLTITNRSELDVKLAMAHLETKGFRVKLPETIKAGESAEASLIVDEDRIESSFVESFTFEATSPMGRYRYSVPVNRTYRPKKR